MAAHYNNFRILRERKTQFERGVYGVYYGMHPPSKKRVKMRTSSKILIVLVVLLCAVVRMLVFVYTNF